ncbi:MAG: tyrosine-type recombinase/integrase [Lachnospiraceae bacterium]|nr:tyrosine-type recombinase/integrase [Lachnospiraceae bacterium]
MEREKDYALVEGYLSHLEKDRGFSENTIQAYRCDLQKLYDFANETQTYDVSEMRSAFFAQLEERLLQSKASDSAVARFVSSVRGFFRYLYEEREVRIDYGKELENPRRRKSAAKVQPKQHTILSLKEISLLLDAPDKDTWQGARDAALMELMYAGGIRAGEIILLRYHDLDLQLNMVTVRTPSVKGEDRELRLVPFGDRARRALMHYIGMSRDIFTTPYAFVFVAESGHTLTRQSVWKIIRKHAAAAGIGKEISPQTLRRSLISHLMENGADEKSLQQILGASSPATARRYRREDSSMRRAYNKMQKLR